MVQMRHEKTVDNWEYTVDKMNGTFRSRISGR
jgi:hypothetical protein